MRRWANSTRQGGRPARRRRMLGFCFTGPTFLESACVRGWLARLGRTTTGGRSWRVWNTSRKPVRWRRDWRLGHLRRSGSSSFRQRVVSDPPDAAAPAAAWSHSGAFSDHSATPAVRKRSSSQAVLSGFGISDSHPARIVSTCCLVVMRATTATVIPSVGALSLAFTWRPPKNPSSRWDGFPHDIELAVVLHPVQLVANARLAPPLAAQLDLARAPTTSVPVVELLDVHLRDLSGRRGPHGTTGSAKRRRYRVVGRCSPLRVAAPGPFCSRWTGEKIVSPPRVGEAEGADLASIGP